MLDKKIPPLRPGDIVMLKKPHPCGGDRFRVVRSGSDVRVVCLTCGRDMTLPREKLERAVKKTVSSVEDKKEDL